MSNRPRTPRHDQAAIMAPCEFTYAALYFLGHTNVDWMQFHPEGRRHGLHDGPLSDSSWIGAIPKDCYPLNFGRDFFKKFRPLPTQTVVKLSKAGDIAAWTGKARNMSSAHRVNSLREHNRNSGTRCSHGRYNGPSRDQDQVRRHRKQLDGITPSGLG